MSQSDQATLYTRDRIISQLHTELHSLRDSQDEIRDRETKYLSEISELNRQVQALRFQRDFDLETDFAAHAALATSQVDAVREIEDRYNSDLTKMSSEKAELEALVLSREGEIEFL